ncbi:MAG: 2Fe-2S iron-sulfur cluster-binding protein [Candidatus Pacearchaeota archaeon]
MAKIIRIDEIIEFESKEINEKEVKENNNQDLIDKAEELGVPFGCTDGRCGSCRVEIIEGMENLSERTKNEIDMGFDESDNFRLICQCTIKNKNGIVKIKI